MRLAKVRLDICETETVLANFSHVADWC